MQKSSWFCFNLRQLSFVIEKITLDKKMLQVNYPLSLNRSSPKPTSLENSTIQGCKRNIIWFCLNLRLLSFAKKKIPLIKKTVAGKLPLSLNRSSPKPIGREYSTNQGCMQKIIWFCLNLRQLSFAIEKKSTHRHLSLIHI